MPEEMRGEQIGSKHTTLLKINEHFHLLATDGRIDAHVSFYKIAFQMSNKVV